MSKTATVSPVDVDGEVEGPLTVTAAHRKLSTAHSFFPLRAIDLFTTGRHKLAHILGEHSNVSHKASTLNKYHLIKTANI